MRITVLTQLAKGLRVPPELSATLAAELQRLKWFLWHGNVFRSLHTVDDITTERGARTMTVDSRNHRVYLLAAEYGPAPEASPGKRGRPPIVPDSFHIIVVGK